MHVPKLLTVEKSRVKRSKSFEDYSDETDRSSDNYFYNVATNNSDDDDDDNDDETDSLLTTSIRPKNNTFNLLFIVVAIFGIGFTLGQILPSLISLKKTNGRIRTNNNVMQEMDHEHGKNTLADAWQMFPMASPAGAQHDMVNDDMIYLAQMHVTTNDTTTATTGAIPNPTPLPPAAVLVRDAQHLLESLNQNLDSSLLHERVALLPSPDLDHQDMMAIYSQHAYKRLSERLHQLQQQQQQQLKVYTSSTPFRICINGGSSSAGGGSVEYHDLFFVYFAREMEHSYGVTTDIVNRAHGDRNSMHSAWLGESFFVPHTDLLIWEFSINDRQDGLTDARNELILWLHKLIDIYDNDPPVVLLVYLWNKPFSSAGEQGKIVADVYNYHELVAAEYDFVLGHVNLATYLDSFQWSMTDLSQHFLADTSHPNALSHAAIGNMMVDLVNKGNTINPIDYEKDTGTMTEFEWTCGDDMLEQWQILEIFQGDIGGMPKAGFTAEVPRTTDRISPGMLIPHKEFANGTVDYDNHLFSTQRYGLAKPGRVDRHRGVTLPCCHDGRLVFDLADQGPIAAMQLYVHSSTENGFDGGNLGRRHLGSQPRGLGDSIEIVINDEDYTGSVISAVDWNCILSKDIFSEWVVLRENDSDFPGRISFCTKSTWCESSVYTLEHLVAF